MANIPQKPVVNNQQWINGQTKLNQTNLTNGVNQNITNLKTAVDGIIDALGGPGGESASDKTLDQTSISAYDPATTYSQGHVVIHDSKYYRAKENGVTGAWNAAKWSQIALSTPVDPALDTESTNPVQNAVVTAELAKKTPLITVAPAYDSATAYESGVLLTYNQKLYKCIQDAPAGTLPTDTTYFKEVTVKEELDTKAVLGAFNGGGTGVDYADLATNLKTEQGANVEDAIAQLSPISVAVEDGDFAEMTNVKGKSFAYNQLVQNGNFESASGWRHSSEWFSVSVEDNVYKVTVSTAYNDFAHLLLRDVEVKSSHKVLVCATMKSSVDGANFRFRYPFVASVDTLTTSYETYSAIGTFDDGRVAIQAYDFAVDTKYYIKNVMLFDLTAMGIDTNDVDEALAALRAYGIEPTVYNEYSAGKIRDTQPNKIISRGFNQWDEEWEVGEIDSSLGVIANTGSYIRSKNYIKVIPNISYYFKSTETLFVMEYDKDYNFIKTLFGYTNNSATLDSNCLYLKFCTSSGGTTYNHNICINVSNPTLNGTYKPFVKDEHALTLPVMRSAGSVADDKDMVRVGTVDLGTFDWTTPNENGWCQTTTLLSLAKPVSSLSDIPNILCSKFETKSANEVWSTDEFISLDTSPRIVLRSKSFVGKTRSEVKQAMSGVMLNYELATPVAQDPAINLPQNTKVYNGGTLETQYESPNTTPALVSMLYEVNLKNFVEGVGSKEDINWNPQNVASKIDVDKKADKDRYYDTLGAGYSNLANNLIASKGLEVESYFTFEKTGGEQASAIESGNGTLKNLYGKTEKSENLLVLEDAAETTKNGITYKVENGVITLNGTATSSSTVIVFFSGKYLPNGCLYGSFQKGSISGGSINAFITGSSGQLNSYNTSNLTSETFLSSNSLTTGGNYSFVINISNATLTNYIIKPTLTYGSTVPTEWKQGYEGLKHTHITGVKSTGINQWDEQTELGVIDQATGEDVPNSNQLRSKGFIKILSNTTYFVKHPDLGFRLFFYDQNKNLISNNSQSPNSIFVTPTNCSYIRFYLGASYGTTYNHDICINFSNPNINGNYYPYEQDTLDIEFEGNGVGTASDEINVEEKKKYQRFGVVDLGTLDWIYNSFSLFQSNSLDGIMKTFDESLNAICTMYRNTTNDLTIMENLTMRKADHLYIKNTSYTDTASFKTAMSGVYLVYELAEPIVTDVEIPKDTIKVWNGGSMEALGTEVPVGTKIFYQKNIKNFIEGFGEATNWDPNALLDGKQDTLVSGENIKTLNGISLLGSGNYDFVNTGEFDPTSDNPAGQKSIAGAMEKLDQSLQNQIATNKNNISSNTASINQLKESKVDKNASISSEHVVASDGKGGLIDTGINYNDVSLKRFSGGYTKSGKVSEVTYLGDWAGCEPRSKELMSKFPFYLLNRVDLDTYKADGTKVGTGDLALIKMPNCYVKIEILDDGSTTVMFANYKVDDTYQRLAPDQFEWLCLGCYKASLVDGMLRSVAGNNPATSISQKQQIDYMPYFKTPGGTLRRADSQDWRARAMADLLVVGYLGTFNSQENGKGFRGIIDYAWNNGDRSILDADSQKTGVTDSLGRGVETGELTGTSTTASLASGRRPFKVLGMENLWGDVQENVSGLVHKGGRVYAYTGSEPITAEQWQPSDTNTALVDTGIKMATSNGFQEKHSTYGGFLFPTSIGGSDSTGVGDSYWYGSSGWCIMILGGNWPNESSAGLFCLLARKGWGLADSGIGARLSAMM